VTKSIDIALADANLTASDMRSVNIEIDPISML